MPHPSISFCRATQEAASALSQAELLFPDDSNLHLMKGATVRRHESAGEAEQEYLRVVLTRPSDPAWFALADLYSSEHRYPDALRAVKQATPLSLVPYERIRNVGRLYLAMNQPQDALAAFDQAERASPYGSESSELGKEFNAKVAEGRARAYRQLNDLDRAVAQQKLATSLTPENSGRWAALADLYTAQGQTADASKARLQAQSIENSAGVPNNSGNAAHTR